METEFNFLRVHQGLAYFARVRVSAAISEAKAEPTVTVDFEESSIPKGWFLAAEKGAVRAAGYFVQKGGRSPGIKVTSIKGTEVDTNANTVEVAAFCATWRALGGSDAQVKFTIADKIWQVEID